jgi:hypothetical protein
VDDSTVKETVKESLEHVAATESRVAEESERTGTDMILNDKAETKAEAEKDQLLSSSSSSLGSAAALEHVIARRQAHADAGDLERWKFRGLGYLYTHKGMVLQASLGGSNDTTTISDGSPLLKSGRNVVEIHDVNQKLDRDECELLVMWVRVNGPEIFAGAAQVIVQGGEGNDKTAGPCHWEFPFLLQESGIYHVTVKLLLWNPNTSVKGFCGNTTTAPDGKRIDKSLAGMQCPFQAGGPDSVTHPFRMTACPRPITMLINSIKAFMVSNSMDLSRVVARFAHDCLIAITGQPRPTISMPLARAMDVNYTSRIQTT